MLRLRREIHMETDEITFREYFVETCATRAESLLLLPRSGIHVVIQHLHVETACALGDFTSDSAEAENTERCMVNVGAQQEHRPPCFPATLTHIVVGLR